MNLPEIEKLISNAVCDRPMVTIAPMNLYFHSGQVICGARSVMPQNAHFIAHVPPDRLEKGFNEKEWKVIVEKASQILNATPRQNGLPSAEIQAPAKSHYEITEENSKLEERRTEQRLRFRYPVLFSKDLNGQFRRGQMLDVSSGGMAFTCCLDDDRSFSNGEIVTKFQVPRYDNKNQNPDMICFNRIGRICRVNQVNSSLHAIAIKFSKPLSFKPAHQNPLTENTHQLLSNSF